MQACSICLIAQPLPCPAAHPTPTTLTAKGEKAQVHDTTSVWRGWMRAVSAYALVVLALLARAADAKAIKADGQKVVDQVTKSGPPLRQSAGRWGTWSCLCAAADEAGQVHGRPQPRSHKDPLHTQRHARTKVREACAHMHAPCARTHGHTLLSPH